MREKTKAKTKKQETKQTTLFEILEQKAEMELTNEQRREIEEIFAKILLDLVRLVEEYDECHNQQDY